MLLPGEITTAEARAVLAARPAGGYGSSVRFWEARQFEGRKPPSDVAEQAGVNSRWLALTTNVTMGDGFLTAVSLIDANGGAPSAGMTPPRSEEHTSELPSLIRLSYAVFCLKKKNEYRTQRTIYRQRQHRYL